MKGTWIGNVGYRITGVLLLLGMICAAMAQDFSMLKGDANRSGKSSNFLASGPGIAALTWFSPNFSDNIGKTMLIDNLMRPTTTDPDYWTYSGIWYGPGDLNSSASAAYRPTDLNTPPTGVTYSIAATDASNTSPIVITTATNHNLFTGDNVSVSGVSGNTAANNDWVITVISPTTFSLDTSVGNGTYAGGGNVQARSDYQVAECIASDKSGDPRVPLNPTDTLSVFTWTMRNPVAPFFESQNYAVYVHLPTGSTVVGGTQRFQQRYYVYEVDYAGGSYYEVVDTDITGGGWMRLGSGGAPTQKIFSSDGITPITVKLFNTVPRDQSTQVLTTNPIGGSDDLDPSLARPIVYADAVKIVPQVGSYAATPVVTQFNGALGLVNAVVGVLNEKSVGFLGSELITTERGLVTSRNWVDGLKRWTFSPLQESAQTLEIDNLTSGPANGSGPSFNTGSPEVVTASNYRGSGYYEFTAMVTTGSADSKFVWAPTLNPASYDIYVWIPGDSGGETFAHGLQYEIHEGSGPVTNVSIDQSGATVKGWVRLGTRGFRDTATDHLEVWATNFSTDGTDVGRKGYIDSVRFVSPTNLTVTSTPVQTTALVTPEGGGAPVATPVVIVAAENGVIYCLSADGNTDGTTNVIWTYPSTRDASIPVPPPSVPDTWMDPNLNAPTAGNPDWSPIDGVNNVRIAEMPTTGFFVSSPVVANVGGADYVYIGARNGRIYCIEMAGRGDGVAASHKPGTTRRVWTYPDDYPAMKQPAFDEFRGSIAFATNTAGPTIFAPVCPTANDGRMYALDAVGNVGTHTTTTRWTQPALTDPTVGAMAMTPAVDFNQVFIGTLSKDGSSPGQFMALNWDTGAINWNMTGSAQPLSDFAGGPATVDSGNMGGAMPDTVFVSNSNRGLYALDASTGGIQWETYEPDDAINQPLTFTVMSVFDNAGVQTPARIIVAPQSNGKITYWFAETGLANLAGGRFAGGFITQAQNLRSSVAVGWNFMYVGDGAGYLYALSNTAGGVPPGQTPPITPIASPNNPEVADYRNAAIRLVKKSAYVQLRQGTMYYADAIDPLNAISRTPMAFEWGETIYLLVTNFPYKKASLATPPVLNLNFTVGGETIRNVFTEARQFPDISDPNQTNSGYGVLSFTIQAAGANALPPGSGQISIGFNTTDATGSPINLPSSQTQTVFIANPLALVVPGYGVGDPDQTIGASNVTSDLDNLTNGNPMAKLGILGTEGTLAHGQSGTIDIGVIDRSLVELIRGPGRGLQNVRVERNRLQWQIGPTAGEGAIKYPLDSILFPGFEDVPAQYPNNSLDYPDIYAQAITVTKSAAGNAENPVQYPVELLGPTAAGGGAMNETNADTRDLIMTPFGFTLRVPKFQPPNEKEGTDLNGAVPAGYAGLYYVYVDTSGNGVLDRPNSFVQNDSELPAQNREAFRSFSLASSVAVDRRFSVLTPTVDLGSLAEGVGYTPDAPGPANALFDPWTTTYSQLFKPFIVANEGNVNLLNLRLAKATTNQTNATFNAWPIYSASNDDWAWLDGSVDLWSDMDPAFAPMRDVNADGIVMLQKSRPGDRSPRQLTTNPIARSNPNTGVVIDTPRLPAGTYPVQAPRVAITLPPGFPVGTYIGLLEVIDDNEPGSNAATMWQNLDAPDDTSLEPFSDPGLRVTFKVRETRLTSSFSSLAAPSIDDLVSGADTFRYGNLQPSGFRNPANGSLVVAHVSARPTWIPATPGSAITDPQWRIYVSSMQGGDPLTAGGTSPLRDLHAFVPDTANNRWFQQSTVTTNGFPDPTLDSAIWGSSLVGGTAKYGSPVFPAEGMQDPYRAVASGMGTPFANSLMAFVGNARMKEPDGSTSTRSEIFVTPVTVDSSGAVGIGDIYAMTNDPNAAKGRPSILQTDAGFALFYAATVGGRSSIYYVLPSGAVGANFYDGSYFTDSTALDLGEGFESVSSPFVSGRRARGGTLPAGSDGSRVIELTFAGKLHGRPVTEVFYGEIGIDAGLPTGLIPMPIRTRETIFESTQGGTYLANGVQWDTTSPVALGMLRGATYADLEVGGSRQIERGTGIITFDTILGGKAYLDPNMGTVRLSGARPPRDASLQLTYQPRLLRISEGTTAGYATPNFAVDERYMSDPTYWRIASTGLEADETEPIRVGRYVFTYGRAAAGAGQAARPMLKTMRLGVDLPLPVFTNADGSTGTVTISLVNPSDPPLQYYQIDPAKKKIYFTPDDQHKEIQISYEAADPATGALLPGTTTVTGTIEMIVERPEELIQLDQATDESNLFMFLDPFDYSNFRRPGLIWLLWSSTRAGAPDVYMQTIAPRFTPLITGK